MSGIHFNNRFFLAASDSDRRFGTIYEGLLKHERYKGLSATAKWLLAIIITHCTTTKNYKSLFAYRTSEGLDENELFGRGFFILTREQLTEYGFPATHSTRYFKELILGGFITIIHNNQHRKRSNVYRLSTGWKKTDQIHDFAEYDTTPASRKAILHKADLYGLTGMEKESKRALFDTKRGFFDEVAPYLTGERREAFIRAVDGIGA